ncbi:hypothetical protein KUTeg_011742, partial [Tegillarca granosa]
MTGWRPRRPSLKPGSKVKQEDMGNRASGGVTEPTTELGSEDVSNEGGTDQLTGGPQEPLEQDKDVESKENHLSMNDLDTDELTRQILLEASINGALCDDVNINDIDIDTFLADEQNCESEDIDAFLADEKKGLSADIEALPASEDICEFESQILDISSHSVVLEDIQNKQTAPSIESSDGDVLDTDPNNQVVPELNSDFLLHNDNEDLEDSDDSEDEFFDAIDEEPMRLQGEIGRKVEIDSTVLSRLMDEVEDLLKQVADQNYEAALATAATLQHAQTGTLHGARQVVTKLSNAPLIPSVISPVWDSCCPVHGMVTPDQRSVNGDDKKLRKDVDKTKDMTSWDIDFSDLVPKRKTRKPVETELTGTVKVGYQYLVIQQGIPGIRSHEVKVSTPVIKIDPPFEPKQTKPVQVNLEDEEEKYT